MAPTGWSSCQGTQQRTLCYWGTVCIPYDVSFLPLSSSNAWPAGPPPPQQASKKNNSAASQMSWGVGSVGHPFPWGPTLLTLNCFLLFSCFLLSLLPLPLPPLPSPPPSSMWLRLTLQLAILLLQLPGWLGLQAESSHLALRPF